MNRRVMIVLAVLAFCVTARGAENLLKNSSFEERDPNNREMPRYWTDAASNAIPLTFTGEHHEGATSGVVVADGKDHMWRQNVLAPKVRAFTLSAFVKGDDVALENKDNYAMLYGHIIYKGLPYSSATHFYAKIPVGSYDWKRISVAGGTNTDAEIELVHISVTAKLSRGRLLVDEVQLTPNEDITPEALLGRKIDDLAQQLERVGAVDATVAGARTKLTDAKRLLADKSSTGFSQATDAWIKAAEALSHEAWAKMYPEAMTDKPVEARMMYHGGIGQRKEDCDASFDRVQQAGCNGVYHSLGAWTSVIQHSDLVPTEPGWEKFDALKYSIEEAKRRGIKSFAYYAALYGTGSVPTTSKLYQDHPTWFAKGPDPNMPTFPDPANPEVVEYTVKVYTELATKYDLDGVGLDYIRYPTETALNYDENNRKQIKERYGIDIMEGGIDVSRVPEKWAKIREYRAEKVANIVQRVHDAVKKVKPKMSLIACLISEPDIAREYGQNWANSATWLDYATPMNYDDRSADAVLLGTQRDLFAKKKALFIPALGGMPEVHQAWTISEWAKRVAQQRKTGCDGIIIYRIGGFDPAVGAFFGKGPFYNKAKFPEPPVK